MNKYVADKWKTLNYTSILIKVIRFVTLFNGGLVVHARGE